MQYAKQQKRKTTNQNTRKVFERYLTVTEERKLYAAVKQINSVLAQRDYAWMRLLRQTGLRVGTLAQLTVFDAQQALRTQYLDIRHEIAKGGHGGKVFVTRAGRTALGDLLRIRKLQGHGAIADAPLVMSRQGGRGLSVRAFESAMAQWVARAGLEVKASPHWFRHTLGKRIMQGSTAADPRGIVQGVLLHHSVDSTAVYTMPDREDIERAMEEAS